MSAVVDVVVEVDTGRAVRRQSKTGCTVEGAQRQAAIGGTGVTGYAISIALISAVVVLTTSDCGCRGTDLIQQGLALVIVGLVSTPAAQNTLSYRRNLIEM